MKPLGDYEATRQEAAAVLARCARAFLTHNFAEALNCIAEIDKWLTQYDKEEADKGAS
jgi:hypothetical protein